MTKIKFYTQIIKTITVTALVVSCGHLYGKQANTQSANLILASIKYEPPPPPPSSGEPTGRAQGGAGRGCEPTALAPIMKSTKGDYFWGQTVSARPQFLFALPRNMTTKDAIEFVLKDNKGKPIYQTRLQSQIPQGIVSFTIPNTIPLLQIGQTYNWSFSVYCDFATIEDKPGNVQGGIQRVAVSTKLKNQLAGAKTPVEQAIVYAKNGIWFDSLSTLAVNMRGNKPKDVSSAWSQLLQQANLEKVTSFPVTNCCTQPK